MEDDRADVAALVAAAVEGDQRAWEALVDRYAPLICAVLAPYRLCDADREDIVQIVWLRLVEHLGELREPRALPKWLVVTTRNECHRWLRMARRVRPFDPLTEDPGLPVDEATPDEPVLLAERWQAVLAGMAELSDRQRAVLRIFAEEPGIRYEEVARRLDIPKGSIGPTLGRAVAKLRRLPEIAALSDSEADTDDDSEAGTDDLGGGQDVA